MVAAETTDLRAAVQHVADKLKGTFAFAAISARELGVLATATSGGMVLFQGEGGLITSCAVDDPSSEKNGYPHYMLKEIYEQSCAQ